MRFGEKHGHFAYTNSPVDPETLPKELFSNKVVATMSILKIDSNSAVIRDAIGKIESAFCKVPDDAYERRDILCHILKEVMAEQQRWCAKVIEYMSQGCGYSPGLCHCGPEVIAQFIRESADKP